MRKCKYLRKHPREVGPYCMKKQSVNFNCDNCDMFNAKEIERASIGDGVTVTGNLTEDKIALLRNASALLQKLNKAVERMESMNDLLTNTLNIPVNGMRTDDLKKVIARTKGVFKGEED